MKDFTFRIKSNWGNKGPVVQFAVTADDENQAVTRAQRILTEQTDKNGEVPVDLTYGLTEGHLLLDPKLIRAGAIIGIRDLGGSTEPF